MINVRIYTELINVSDPRVSITVWDTRVL